MFLNILYLPYLINWINEFCIFYDFPIQIILFIHDANLILAMQ